MLDTLREVLGLLHTDCMGHWQLADAQSVACHSCGTKPPCWRARNTPGQDAQRDFI